MYFYRICVYESVCMCKYMYILVYALTTVYKDGLDEDSTWLSATAWEPLAGEVCLSQLYTIYYIIYLL